MTDMHTDGTPASAPSQVHDTATQIAQLYRRVLGVSEVGHDDDFFVLGGTSLSAMELLDLIDDELGIRLPVRNFYQATSVGDLAEEVHALAGRAGGE
jgi:acyl carrier protein